VRAWFDESRAEDRRQILELLEGDARRQHADAARRRGSDEHGGADELFGGEELDEKPAHRMPDGCGRSVMGSDVPDDEPRIVDKIGDRGAAEGRARLAPAAPAKVERVGGKPAAGEEGEPVVPDGRVGEITVDEQHRRTRDSFRPCMQHSDSLELQSLDHRPRRDNFLAGGNTPSDMTLPPLEPTMQPYSR